MRLSFPSLSELGVILFAVFQWCHANVLSESATKMRGAAKAQGVCYFGNTFFAILQHFLGLLKLLSQNKGRWRLTGFVFEKRGKITKFKEDQAVYALNEHLDEMIETRQFLTTIQ